MFASRLLTSKARLLTCRRMYSTRPRVESLKLVIGAVGGLALAGGYAYGLQVELSATDGNSNPSNASTRPLNTLSSPKYADADEFALAVSEIKALLDPSQLDLSPEVISAHGDLFFTTHHPPDPTVQRAGVVICPRLTEEVSQILQICHKYKVPVVANLGLTSLEGHNMQTRGPHSISVLLLQMNHIVACHPEDLDCVVQAGVGWEDLDDYLRGDDSTKHLLFGPDPGMGANIGGMVGTSASGTNAYRYGTMKENVVSLTVVLADGTIVKTRQRPRKLSAGYDLTHIFIGLEGTLGIVTEITVKLHVRPAVEYVSMALFKTIGDAASAALKIVAHSGLQPNALEILDGAMMGFVNTLHPEREPLLEQPSLFLKLGGPTSESIAHQLEIIGKIAKECGSTQVKQSTNSEENEVLWSARRMGLYSVMDHGRRVLKNPNDVQVWTTDIAVPLLSLAKVVSETNDDLNTLGLYNQFLAMGHVGDGNCHFCIIYNLEDYGMVQAAVDRMVMRALKLEGTCTGEHGVGMGKRKYLDHEIGTSSVDLMRSIKLALDPLRILNPDKVFRIDPKDDWDERLAAGHVKEKSDGCKH